MKNDHWFFSYCTVMSSISAYATSYWLMAFCASMLIVYALIDDWLFSVELQLDRHDREHQARVERVRALWLVYSKPGDKIDQAYRDMIKDDLLTSKPQGSAQLER